MVINMKAIILAAGLGSRLAPLTDSIPKSLVQVNGVPIIVQQINNLLKNGIEDIIVVSGYKADVLEAVLSKKFPRVSFVCNTDYQNTNNMYSAYLAREAVRDTDFLMMNADVFFDSSVIHSLLGFKASNAVVVDIGSYIDESMKVTELDGRLVAISKSISKELALGNSIDVYKFSLAGGMAFFGKCCEYIESKREIKLWSEVALNDILEEVEFNACPIDGRWFEIDNYDDLKAAEVLFKE